MVPTHEPRRGASLVKLRPHSTTPTPTSSQGSSRGYRRVGRVGEDVGVCVVECGLYRAVVNIKRRTAAKDDRQNCRVYFVCSANCSQPGALDNLARIAIALKAMLDAGSYVASSLSVFVFVCLSVCLSHWWAVQKRLNRSRCRLGGGRLVWAQEVMY